MAKKKAPKKEKKKGAKGIWKTFEIKGLTDPAWAGLIADSSPKIR